MAINKPVLSSSFWKGCDEMCGGEEGLLDEARTDRASQTLTVRIKQVADRYATPLPCLAEEVAALTARVDEHLRKMGFVWN